MATFNENQIKFYKKQIADAKAGMFGEASAAVQAKNEQRLKNILGQGEKKSLEPFSQAIRAATPTIKPVVGIPESQQAATAQQEAIAQQETVKKIKPKTLTPAFAPVPIKRKVESAATVDGLTKGVKAAVAKPKPTFQESTAEIRSQIADRTKSQMVDRFKAAFQATQGRLAQEQEAVAPRFREQESRIGTQDIMARERAEKVLATQGLSGAGARGQTDIAQSVITQGALGQSRQQEQALRGDIERRLSEAQSLRDQGIATAESEADIASLTDQLNQLNIAEANRREDEQRAVEQANLDREFELRKQGMSADQAYKQAQLELQQQKQATTTQAQQFGQQLDLAQFNQGIAEFEAQMTEKQRQFDRSLAFDSRKQTFNERQNEIDNAVRQGQLTLNEAQLQLQKDKFTADNDPNSVDNQIKSAQLENIQAETAQLGQPQPIKTTDFKTNPDFAEDFARISNSSNEEKQELLNALSTNAQSFISKYGLDGYNALVSEAEKISLR